MPRRILLNNQVSDRLVFAEDAVASLFHQLDAHPNHAIPEGELSIAFLNDATLAHLHAEFLNDPTPTDVITFPGDPEEALAGEILVSAERAAAEAPRQGLAFSEELTLYLVHGWLHLAGLDDREADARQAMRQAEQSLLAYLATQSAHPAFSWQTEA